MTRSRPDSPDAQHDGERAHVVGVDPGLNRTGYAVMSRSDGKLVLHEAGVPPIHTPVTVLAQLPEDVKKNHLHLKIQNLKVLYNHHPIQQAYHYRLE